MPQVAELEAGAGISHRPTSASRFAVPGTVRVQEMLASAAVVIALWLRGGAGGDWGSLFGKTIRKLGSIYGMPYFSLEQSPLRLLFSPLD